MKRAYRILLALVVLLVGVLFALLLERREVEVIDPPSREAQRNPYLAAGRLLERMGLPSSAQRNPRIPPPTTAIVFLPAAAPMDEAAIRRWAQWVEQGGILVAGIGIDAPRRELLGLVEARPFELAEQKDAELEVGNVWQDSSALAEAGAADPEAPRETFDLEVAPKVSIDLDEMEESSTLVLGYAFEEHLPITRFAHGEGAIVMLADDALFTNDRLREADHAAFLWSLTSADPRPTEALFVLRDQRPVLGEYLRAAWPLWTALGLWLLLFVAVHAGRFGPLIDEAPPEHRGLREHLLAAGRFLWRRHELAPLVAATRQATRERAANALPGWSALPPRERAAALAAALKGRAAIPAARLDAVLEGPLPTTAEDFFHQVSILETVRRSL